MQTIRLGITSNIATCRNCEWLMAAWDRAAGYKLIRQHVKDTGHTVMLETVTATHYKPKSTRKET